MSARLPVPEGEPRIVSLIASATEIVYSLGLGPYLVGRSHECDFPVEVERLPCCTAPRIDVSGSSVEIDRLVKGCVANALSVYEVFDEALESLQPTHILTQTQCEVCAVSLKDVERSVAGRLASSPQIISLQAESLADIWADMRRVAMSTGIDPEPVVQNLQFRMDVLRDTAHLSARRPRVACIEWLEPLMAAGNWMPELVELANAENLFGTAGKHSPWMTWEDLVAAEPDYIIVMPCGFSLARTLEEMHWITSRPEYSRLSAVAAGNIYATDGNQYFNRPGPRVVESLQILCEILHADHSRRDLEGTAYIRA